MASQAALAASTLAGKDHWVMLARGRASGSASYIAQEPLSVRSSSSLAKA